MSKMGRGAEAENEAFLALFLGWGKENTEMITRDVMVKTEAIDGMRMSNNVCVRETRKTQK